MYLHNFGVEKGSGINQKRKSRSYNKREMLIQLHNHGKEIKARNRLRGKSSCHHTTGFSNS